MKLIHISDIHINPEPLFGMDPVLRFQTCMDHVSKHHADADMVAISGDLTHHGQRSSYMRLQNMLSDWDMTPHLMIGNHDNRGVFQEIFPQVETDENDYVQYVVDRPEGQFVFLDTVQTGTHAGHFDQERLAWLERHLGDASSTGKPAYLFMHHNPADVGVPGADIIGLVPWDGEPFRALIKQYRNTVRHIFFGHCHYILSGSLYGIPISAPRSTSHNFAPEFTRVDIMGSAPFPPTYNVCLISDEAVIVHSIDFLDEDKIDWIEIDGSGWIEEDVPVEG